MVERVILKNFKCYKDQTIEFGRVTTITGSNSQGKSSGTILPLKILLTNSNFTESMIMFGEDEADIQVDFESGSIRKTRNDQGQTLSLKKNGKWVVYTGKKGLDQEVRNLSGVKKISIDEDNSQEDINFRDPSSGLFLIGKGSEVVRRRLSGVLQLNVLEGARNKLSDRLKKTEPILTKISDELFEKEKQLVKIDREIELVEEMDIIQSQLVLLKDLNQLKLTLMQMEDLTERFKIVEYTLISVPKVRELDEKLYQSLEKLCGLEQVEKEISLLLFDQNSMDYEIGELKTQLDEMEFCVSCGRLIES